MSWIAIVPLKAAGTRKTRLIGALHEDTHTALTVDMARHVIATLATVAAVGSIRVLSPAPDAMPGTVWEPDRGEGLNAELDRVCEALAGQRLLIIHADLPLLGTSDVHALIAAAEADGAAIAPDRHGQGTNALALRAAARIGLAFGPDSFARHLACMLGAATVRREGLALDIDTADDIAAARRALPLGRW